MNNRELFDLLLLGLTWLSEEDGDDALVPRRATMVYRTWVQVGKLTGTQRSAIATNSTLVTYAKKHRLEIASGTVKPKKGDIRKLVGTSERHLIVLGVGRGEPTGSLIFGSSKTKPGYHLLPTDAGKAYVDSQSARQANTKQMFLSAWPEVCRSFWRQMGGMKRRQGADAASPGTQSAFGRGIPAARITPDDWEW